MKVVSLEELEDKIYSLDWSEVFDEKIFLVGQVYRAINRLNTYEAKEEDLKPTGRWMNQAKLNKEE